MANSNPYLQWYPGALALARNILGCSAAAEDVLQTAFSKTIRGATLPNDAAAQRMWFFTVVRQALRSLPSEQREIIVLRDVNDFSYADIAQILQLNSGTVMSRLHRARIALRAASVALEQQAQPLSSGGKHAI